MTTGYPGIVEQLLIQAKAVGITVVWTAIVALIAFKIADLIVDSSEQINPGPARRTRAVYLALIARGWAGLHQPRLGAWVRRRPADQVERSHCDEGTATVEQSALAASAWH